MKKEARYALASEIAPSGARQWKIDKPTLGEVQIIEQCPAVLLATDLDLRITMAQGTGLTAIGGPRHQLLGWPIQRFFRSSDSEAFPVDIYRLALAGQENSWERVWKSRTFAGQVGPLFDREGNLVGTITIAVDITERKKKEEARLQEEIQRQEANKVRSLKTLAGGVAHNFNNLLSAVMGYTSLALMELSVDSPVRGMLMEIDAAAQCAANLAGQMLLFAQKSSMKLTPVNVSRLIESMWPHLQISVGENIVLLSDLAEKLPDIAGDAIQLRNLVVTLVRNASDSLGDGSRTIRLSTQVIHGDRSVFEHMGAELAQGEYVWLQVSDSGCGMDEETRARIFEPFFSTKFTGRGLGMAIARGIVQSHRGTIAVASKPGMGSTIHVFLPTEQTIPYGEHDSTAESPNWGQRLKPTEIYCGR